MTKSNLVKFLFLQQMIKLEGWVQPMTNLKSEICLRSLKKKRLMEGGGN